MTRVFVYGSLLRGEPNHRLLVGSRFVRAARTRPEFTMHDLGAFPAIALGGRTAICGEVYEVDGPTLERLDRLEGHPQLYRREVVQLDATAEHELACIYVFVAALGRAPAVPSGDWRGYKEKSR